MARTTGDPHAFVAREIERLEDRRVQALSSGDIAALGELISEDLVHIHGTGRVEGKRAYLAGVASKFRFHRIERGDLTIRQFGDIVVVNGSLSQTVSVKGVDKPNDTEAMVTQTWIRGDDGWKQNTCHMGVVAPPKSA